MTQEAKILCDSNFYLLLQSEGGHPLGKEGQGAVKRFYNSFVSLNRGQPWGLRSTFPHSNPKLTLSLANLT